MRHDGPRMLAGLAVAALPSSRVEWGRAMVCELAHVDGRAARWRFALGCAAVAARSGSARGVAAVGAGVAALVGYTFARWPGVLADRPTAGVAHVAVLAVLLGSYAAAALALAGSAGRTRAARTGVVVGAVAAAPWGASLAASMLSDPGRLDALVVITELTAGAALMLAGARFRGGRAGARVGLVGGLVVGLAGFVTVLALIHLATGHVTTDPALVAGYHPSDARDVPTYTVGQTMAVAVNQLWLAPAVGAVLGAMGGAVARVRR